MNQLLLAIQTLGLLTTTATVGKTGFELKQLTVFCSEDLFMPLITLASSHGITHERFSAKNSGINFYFEL